MTRKRSGSPDKGQPTSTVALGNELSRLWTHLSRKRRAQLGALGLFMIVGAIAEMATLGAVIPFLALLSAADARTCAETDIFCRLTLVQASFLFVVVSVLAVCIRVALLKVSTRFTFALGADLGGSVYARTLHQPYPFHVARNTSETIASINKVNLVVQNVIYPLMQGFVASILAIALFLSLLIIDALSAFAAISLFGALYVGASLITRRLLRHNSRVIAETEGQRVQAIQEGLGGIRDVLIDGTQGVYSGRFDHLNAKQRMAQASNAFVRTSPRYVIEGVGMILMVGLALWIHERDGLAAAIPVLGALALGSQKLLPQLQQVYASWSSINGSRVALHDVLNTLALPLPESDTFTALATRGGDPSNDSTLLRLKSVSFSYRPTDPLVLHEINMEIACGDRVGLIGKTGSGKSTLIDLIMGLLTPTTGVICVGDRPLERITVRDWQRRIAHVPQAIYLSDASIAENIAFGVPSSAIDRSRVMDAARRAKLDEFLLSLPAGLDSKVGERGVRLSGGQRQRIGLARAMYKQADVLVLDEATSALDNATERDVMEAIESLGRGVTVILIAHRLSTLSGCDHIVELDAGRIVRVGSYAHLILNGQSVDEVLQESRNDH